MTFGERVKTLRLELGFSQEALGAQGFVSAPGWIKIENGQRQASEKLIDSLVRWLVEQQHVRLAASKALREELLVLKYLGSSSPFVRELARAQALSLPNAAELLASGPKAPPRRGRPAARR